MDGIINQSEFSSRVQVVLDKSKMTDRRFALNIGIDPSNFKKKLKGNIPWTINDLRKLTEIGISQEWLIDGEGDVPVVYDRINSSYKDTIDNVEQKRKHATFNADAIKDSLAREEKTKPRLPIKVVAGKLGEYYDGIYESECEMTPVVRQFPQYDFTMVVRGNSMFPKFEGGDEIACRKVNKTIQWGHAYVLDTSDGAFLKRIFEVEDDDTRIRCVSYNEEYPDFYVDKIDIIGIYRVVGLIRFGM